jgi:hypothetical protein
MPREGARDCTHPASDRIAAVHVPDFGIVVPAAAPPAACDGIVHPCRASGDDKGWRD